MKHLSYLTIIILLFVFCGCMAAKDEPVATKSDAATVTILSETSPAASLRMTEHTIVSTLGVTQTETTVTTIPSEIPAPTVIKEKTMESSPTNVGSDIQDETYEEEPATVEENTQEWEEEPIPSPQYEEPDEDDLYYLAAAVCCEASGEDMDIMLKVANVVVNRVNSSSFPNSIYRVLTAKHQYGTFWCDGIYFPSWATDEDINASYTAARRILNGERVLPYNVVYQAEFPQGSGTYRHYEGFYFCYE